MCSTCGCSDDAGVRVIDPAHGHSHEPRRVTLEERVLAKNDDRAAENRRWLADHGILAVNVMSSPGSGKTTLLVRTIKELDGQLPLSVVEGDQETLLDAERIRATGCPVVQINTGAGCHLDAEMLMAGLTTLRPADNSLVLVENVGNLVCPALFDLGEHSRVAVMSVTEGTDKPLKYPHLFRTADLVLVNKIDLLSYVDFDPATFAGYARQVRPGVDILHVSATTGAGTEGWYDWLRNRRIS